MAFADLVVASKKTLGMTGTIFGGKALSLFFMLYRMSDEVRNAFTDTELIGRKRIRWQEWVSKYGVEQETRVTLMEEQTGQMSGKNYSKVSVKELPGSSPAMLPWLLNRTVFISLRDLGYALPDYKEIPVTIQMSEEMERLYRLLHARLKAELAERMASGDKSLLGAYLQALLCWVDSPWRPEIVICPYTKNREKEGIKPIELVRIPGIPGDQLFPKEKAIIDLILEHKEKGRRSLLFCQQTNKRDITGRWVKILADAGLKATVLRAAPDKREEWVDKQVEQGVDVIITHPKRVETGLDLLQFPTLIWLGIEYSVYTVMQASRRSWRIGQEEDVQVYFFNYDQTLQHDATHLIAAKMAAAARVNGDQIANDSLAELDSLTNSDMVSALATIVAGGNRATQSLSDAFASANKEFGMADRMIGGYQVTDQLSSRSNGQVEETTKTVQVEETIKMAQVEEMLPAINVRNADGRAYQLSLLLEPTRSQNTYQAELDSHHNGHQNGSIKDHHNGYHNGHQNTYQAELDERQKDYLSFVSPPQLSMDILHEVNCKKRIKRRSKFHRAGFLFKMLQAKK